MLRQGQIHEVRTIGRRLVYVLSPDDVCQNQEEADIRVALVSHCVDAAGELDIVVELEKDAECDEVYKNLYGRLMVECWNDFGIFKTQLWQEVAQCNDSICEGVKTTLRKAYNGNSDDTTNDSREGFRTLELMIASNLARPVHQHYYELASNDDGE